MKRRSHPHADEYVSRASDTMGPLFAQPFAQRLAPSVPVDSSEAGADKAEPSVTKQCNAILVALRAAGCVPASGKYLSREALSVRLNVTEHALCGRLGPSGPLLIPKGRTSGPWPVQAYAAACVSSSGVHVIGYQLSDYGVEQADRLAKRIAA